MTTPAPLPSWPPYDGWLAGGERLALPRLARTVFTRVDGPADGPPVTLVHGFPTSSHDWALTVPALAAAHRVVTLDLLGFGDSDKPPGHRYSCSSRPTSSRRSGSCSGCRGALWSPTTTA